jgi:hypothetical protein
MNEKSKWQGLVLKNISQKLRQFEIVRASAVTHTHYSATESKGGADVNPPASFDLTVYFKLEEVTLQPMISARDREEKIATLERKLLINTRKEKMDKARARSAALPAAALESARRTGGEDPQGAGRAARGCREGGSSTGTLPPARSGA